jgi:hypothetical protein
VGYDVGDHTQEKIITLQKSIICVVMNAQLFHFYILLHIGVEKIKFKRFLLVKKACHMLIKKLKLINRNVNINSIKKRFQRRRIQRWVKQVTGIRNKGKEYKIHFQHSEDNPFI